jgi:hypothetical protein
MKFLGLALQSCCWVLLLAAASLASEDSWFVLSMEGSPAGYIHEQVVPQQVDGRKVLVARTDSKMVIKRLGRVVEFRVQTEMLEDAETGAVVSGEMIMHLSQSPTRTTLEVRGAQAVLTSNGRATEIDWNPEIRGAEWRRRTMLEQGATQGKVFEFPVFVFELGSLTTSKIEVVGPEKVEVDGQERELLHVKTSIEAMAFVINDEWYDRDLRLYKSKTVQMGLTQEATRANAAQALASLDGSDMAEVFVPLTPHANFLLPRPYATDEVVLHITPVNPEMSLPEFDDERQTTIERADGGAVNLRLRRREPPQGHGGTRPLQQPPAELVEYLASTPFLQCDDPLVMEAATKVVGEESNAWEAARKLESFVYSHIDEKSLDVAFASAREVLECREGDCSEHGVLLAALCRSAGIPSRVAAGLLYFNGGFGGHMWAEVNVAGTWYALDGTLGRGGVGASHLKMSSSSLRTTGISEAFVELLRGLGNLNIEILAFRHGDREITIPQGFSPWGIADGRYANYALGIAVSSPQGWEYSHVKPANLKNIVFKMKPTAESEPLHAELRLFTTRLSVDNTMNVDKVVKTYRNWGYDFSYDVARQVDGRPGRLLSGADADGDAVALCAVAAHGSLFALAVHGPQDGKQLPTLIGILKTLDFDGDSPAGKP